MESSKTKYLMNEIVKRELDKAKIVKPEQVLQLSEFGLLRVGSLTTNLIDGICKEAATALLKSGFQTAFEIEKNQNLWQRISTGCSILDKVLRGGFQTHGITEISGESGCGKTQLCLQLCLSVQYPESLGGLGAGAVFICTEDSFPSRRMKQLFQAHPVKRCGGLPQKSLLSTFGDKIFVEHIADPEGMRQCVLGRLPKLMAQVSIRLVVIDSIAGIYRSTYDKGEYKDRAKDMRAVGGQLHNIAKHFRASIICVNQVGAIMAGNNPSLHGAGSKCAPALGLAWANMVTTRIQMHRMEPGGADTSPSRYFEVVFAPHLSQGIVHYNIHEAGVFGISK